MGNKRLHHLSGYDVALKLGVDYTGDVNVIDHGGLFYKLDDVEHGYISCVSFSEADGLRCFDVGSINIPHTTFGEACKLVDECLQQYMPEDREKMTEDDMLPHVMADFLRFKQGIESERFEWFILDGEIEDTIGEKVERWQGCKALGRRLFLATPDGRDPLILTENQALNQALRCFM